MPQHLPASDLLVVHEEVREALDAGVGVVALESTILAHGLPHPDNIEIGGQIEDAVRAGSSCTSSDVRSGATTIRNGLSAGASSKPSPAPEGTRSQGPSTAAYAIGVAATSHHHCSTKAAGTWGGTVAAFRCSICACSAERHGASGSAPARTWATTSAYQTVAGEARHVRVVKGSARSTSPTTCRTGSGPTVVRGASVSTRDLSLRRATGRGDPGLRGWPHPLARLPYS